MALREYRCADCGEVRFAFDGEGRLNGACEPADSSLLWNEGMNSPEIFPHEWKKMPPKFTTVLATSLFMTDAPFLDSFITVYELDRVLNLEARAEKETEMYQELRRNT
jgi:hypothetical protein